MNVYRVCLEVEKDIFYKTNDYVKKNKYVWIVSANLSNTITYLEKLLKTEYTDYYFVDMQLMGEARVYHNES